jgi:hypothetical protein
MAAGGGYGDRSPGGGARALAGIAAVALMMCGCQRVEQSIERGNPFASFEKRCDALPPTAIEVAVAPLQTQDNDSTSQAALTGWYDNASPNHRTVGLTKGNFSHRTTLEVSGIEDARNHRACGRPTIRVVISASPLTVYVASEYARDACRARLILEHEMKHVAVYREVLPAAAGRLRRELRAVFGSAYHSGGEMGAVQAELGKRLDAELSRFMAETNVELRARNAAVDSAEEYARFDRPCAAE